MALKQTEVILKTFKGLFWKETIFVLNSALNYVLHFLICSLSFWLSPNLHRIQKKISIDYQLNL